MKKIGITGGISSGKSFISSMFDQIGVPIYSSDKRAKELMLENPIKSKLIQNFGEEIYCHDGSLNVPTLRNLVFNDPLTREKINQIVHPEVKKDYESWHARQSSPYTLKETALLFETNDDKNLDWIIVIYAPLYLRKQWLAKRDNINLVEINKRLNSQLTDYEKLKKANFVIYNDGLQEPLDTQILNLHKKLI